MGTRSLTFVYDEDGTPIINLYRQFDGYREGHGRDVAQFLEGLTVINGYSLDDNRRMANGMGCLAAQLVAKFKVGCGLIYLHSVDSTDCWQDYEFHIFEDKVHVIGYGDTVFNGTWEKFIEWARAEEPQEQE